MRAVPCSSQGGRYRGDPAHLARARRVTFSIMTFSQLFFAIGCCSQRFAESVLQRGQRANHSRPSLDDHDQNQNHRQVNPPEPPIPHPPPAAKVPGEDSDQSHHNKRHIGEVQRDSDIGGNTVERLHTEKIIPEANLFPENREHQAERQQCEDHPPEHRVLSHQCRPLLGTFGAGRFEF